MMTKENSDFFKGIALLMMLFVHTDSSMLVPFMEFDGKSIWSYFYMSNTPVALFLILSGYGFYSIVQKENDKNYGFRLMKLFIHFWIIFLIIIPLTRTVVDTDVRTVLSNVTGWHVSWNGTCWFIFPYVILASTYKLIYSLGNKIGWVKFLLASFVLYLIGGFIASRNHITYITATPFLYNAIYLMISQFSFIAGMAMNKYSRVCFGLRDNKMEGAGCLFILLIVIKCSLKTTSLDPLYAVLFIILAMRAFTCRNVILETLGKHSLNIWMSHAFLMTYVYKYEYDILYIVALLVFSLCFSVIVNIIALPLERMAKKIIDWAQK